MAGQFLYRARLMRVVTGWHRARRAGSLLRVLLLFVALLAPASDAVDNSVWQKCQDKSTGTTRMCPCRGFVKFGRASTADPPGPGVWWPTLFNMSTLTDQQKTYWCDGGSTWGSGANVEDPSKNDCPAIDNFNAVQNGGDCTGLCSDPTFPGAISCDEDLYFGDVPLEPSTGNLECYCCSEGGDACSQSMVEVTTSTTPAPTTTPGPSVAQWGTCASKSSASTLRTCNCAGWVRFGAPIGPTGEPLWWPTLKFANGSIVCKEEDFGNVGDNLNKECQCCTDGWGGRSACEPELTCQLAGRTGLYGGEACLPPPTLESETKRPPGPPLVQCIVAGSSTATYLNLYWKPPLDRGAGIESPFNLNISLPVYRINVGTSAAELEANSSNTKTFDVDNSMFIFEDGNLKWTLSSIDFPLTLRSRYFVRIRAQNPIGFGNWSQIADIFVDTPGPPAEVYVGAGIGEAKFLRFYWKPPLDRGAGVESPFNLNISLPVYRIHVGTSAAELEASTSNTKIFDVDDATFKLADDSNLKWTLYSIDFPLTLGSRYFARIRAQNPMGFGNWSTIANKSLVLPPKEPKTIRLQSVASLHMRVWWTAPDDTGAGVGNVYPLLKYQVVLQQTAIAANPLAATSLVKLLDASVNETEFSMLQKGVQYFAFVRALNDAGQYPGDEGYGPWGIGSASCVDGSERRDVCAGNGVHAVHHPEKVSDLQLLPIGDGLLTAVWWAPSDTGNGLSTYPLVRYDLHFASNAKFDNVTGFTSKHRSERDNFTTPRGQFQAGQTKYVRVRAVNDAGVGNWSTPVSAPVLLFPGTPQGMRLTNGNLSILVQFDRPSNTGAGAGQPWPLLGYELDIVTPIGTCPNETTRHRVLQIANETKSFTMLCTDTQRSYPACQVVFASLEPGSRPLITVEVANSDFGGTNEYVDKVTVGGATVGERYLQNSGEDSKCDKMSKIIDSVQTPLAGAVDANGELKVRVTTSPAVGGVQCHGANTLYARVTIVTTDSKPITKNNYTVLGLVKGCEYSFRLRAKNQVGVSIGTVPLVEMFLDFSSKPSNLVVSSGMALEMILSWGVPIDAGDGRFKTKSLMKGYRVQISNVSSFEGPFVHLLHSSETTAQVLTVEHLPRRELFARVLPITRAGVGQFALGSATPIIPVLPATSVSLSTNVTGAISEVTIYMTVPTQFQMHDRISIRFPAGFGITNIQVGSKSRFCEGRFCENGLENLLIDTSLGSLCGTDCKAGPDMVMFKKLDSSTLAPNSTILLSVVNVTNRNESGAVTFDVRVINASGTFTKAQALNVSGGHLVEKTTSQRITMTLEEAKVLSQQASIVVASVIAGSVAASLAGAGAGGGAMAVIGQVQTLSQLGKVGGGEGSSAMSQFSEGFSWANFELPVSIYDVLPKSTGTRRNPAQKLKPGETVASSRDPACKATNLSPDKKSQCNQCGFADGVPLMDKAWTACGSMLVVFCCREFVRVLIRNCWEKDPGDMLKFPNWEGPMMLALWFGSCDTLFKTIGRPCSLWYGLSAFFLFVGPICFMLYSTYSVASLIRNGHLKFVEHENMTWREARVTMKEAKDIRGKLKILGTWYTYKFHHGEWEDADDTHPHAKFWNFLIKDLRGNSWWYCSWVLLRKLLFAGAMALMISFGNSISVLLIHVLDLIALIFLQPNEDKLTNVQELLSGISNLASITFVSMPVFTGADLPEVLSDWMLVGFATGGTALAAISSAVAPIMFFFSGIFNAVETFVAPCMSGVGDGVLGATAGVITEGALETAEEHFEVVENEQEVPGAVAVGSVALGGAGAGAIVAMSEGDPKLQGRANTMKHPAILVAVKLLLDFKEAGEADSMKRSTFKENLVRDFANATGLPGSCFEVISVTPTDIVVSLSYTFPNSMLVRLKIDAGETEQVAPSSVFSALHLQLRKPESLLGQGELTCNLHSIEIADSESDGHAVQESKSSSKTADSVNEVSATKSPIQEQDVRIHVTEVIHGRTVRSIIKQPPGAVMQSSTQDISLSSGAGPTVASSRDGHSNAIYMSNSATNIEFSRRSGQSGTKISRSDSTRVPPHESPTQRSMVLKPESNGSNESRIHGRRISFDRETRSLEENQIMRRQQREVAAAVAAAATRRELNWHAGITTSSQDNDGMESTASFLTQRDLLRNRAEEPLRFNTTTPRIRHTMSPRYSDFNVARTSAEKSTLAINLWGQNSEGGSAVLPSLPLQSRSAGHPQEVLSRSPPPRLGASPTFLEDEGEQISVQYHC